MQCPGRNAYNPDGKRYPGARGEVVGEGMPE